MKTIAQQLNVKYFPLIIRDSKGNEIYGENSNGYWSKKEFDSDGNIIYYESSEGQWFKSEFDPKGNRIYYENSEGTIDGNHKIPEYTMEKLVDVAYYLDSRDRLREQLIRYELKMNCLTDEQAEQRVDSYLATVNP